MAVAMKLGVVGALVPLAGAMTTGTGMEMAMGSNPIRKVVTLLSKMQKKVQAEADTAEGLYTKYMCYCKTSGGDLAASIEAAEERLPEDAAAIKGGESKKQQLEADLTQHRKDRASAQKSVAEATAIRKKEKAIYDKNFADGNQNLAAVRKAVAAISKGMTGGFLQLPEAGLLRKLVTDKQELSDDDRKDVLVFLSGRDSGEYAPASGEIVGILKQIGDEMEAAQKDLVDTEKDAVKSFEGLSAAKKKEIAALSGSIEDKLARVGQLGVELATLKNDAEDTAENLEADKKFAAGLKAGCSTKAAVHEQEKKMRAEEVVALADTIKMLNDDDALELFKKTLPSASASFLQVQETTAERRSEAAEMLRPVRRGLQAAHRPHLDFILLALHGKKVGFAKILKLVDELVATLHTEQKDDDAKKDYCTAQLDTTEDTITALKNKLADQRTAIEEAQDGRDKLMEEIDALRAGISALDKAVAEATQNRKAENDEHKDLVRSDSAAKELLLFAKNRLNKFYNPKLSKAPPKRELSEGDQIYENNGGDIPTEAPGGIANTGIEASFVQLQAKRDAPPLPPATAEAYTKKSSQSGGVIAMLDLLVRDLDKEMTESNTEEKNAQAEYEEMMGDSSAKRRSDSKALTDKESAKADADDFLEEATSEEKSMDRKLKGAQKYLASMHSDCDWLLKYYDMRKQARTDEIDSLTKAKAVLNGADYSLLQQSSTLRVTRKFLGARA